ncbi:hypothetical protein ACEPPN_019446 [Leptodophora sp. 'Broadleaf-Isolate-01']
MTFNSDTFKHSDISQPPNQIRVLELDPTSNSSGVLQCSLFAVSLDDPGLRFDAVSYRWADDKSMAILVNDQRLFISHTVYAILCSFESDRSLEPRRVWVDSICINQGNEAEKQWQVGLMQRVYSQAEKVVAWMGDSPASKGALKYAAKLLASATTGSERDLIETWEMERPIGECDPKWSTIQALLNEEWFGRVWVIQEVVLAQKLVLRHGLGEEIPWDTLAEFGEFLFMPQIEPRLRDPTKGNFGIDKTLYRNICNLKSMKNLRESRDGLPSPAHGFDLDSVLGIARNFQATEPHDRIYAMLALTSAETRQAIGINYKLPLRDVVLKVALREFLNTPTAHLSGLYLAGMATRNHRSPYFRHLDLPSWCPDWFSTPQQNFAINGMYCATAMHIPPHVQHDENTPNHIRFRGSDFDTIIRRSRFLDMEAVGNRTDIRQSFIGHFDFVNHCTELCVEAIHHQRGLFRGPFETPLDLFWRTALMDRTQDGECPIPAETLEEFKATCMLFQSQGPGVVSLSNIDIQQIVMDHARELDLPLRKLFMAMGSSLTGKRLCLTGNGYVALCPREAEVGDHVCIIYGAETPFVVRPIERGGIEPDKPNWLIGSCYVQGITNGELAGRKDISLVQLELLFK